MRWRLAGLVLIAVVVIGAAAFALAPGTRATPPALRQQVMQAERGFAAAMARRDFEAFAGYLSREAVFMGAQGTQRGKDAVASAWRDHFVGPAAPFSWEPEDVEVLASGTLAFTSGPVKDAAGRQVGRFHSVWRLEGPGTWKVVFDRACECGR